MDDILRLPLISWKVSLLQGSYERESEVVILKPLDISLGVLLSIHQCL